MCLETTRPGAAIVASGVSWRRGSPPAGLGQLLVVPAQPAAPDQSRERPPPPHRRRCSLDPRPCPRSRSSSPAGRTAGATPRAAGRTRRRRPPRPAGPATGGAGPAAAASRSARTSPSGSTGANRSRPGALSASHPRSPLRAVSTVRLPVRPAGGGAAVAAPGRRSCRRAACARPQVPSAPAPADRGGGGRRRRGLPGAEAAPAGAGLGPRAPPLRAPPPVVGQVGVVEPAAHGRRATRDPK